MVSCQSGPFAWMFKVYIEGLTYSAHTYFRQATHKLSLGFNRENQTEQGQDKALGGFARALCAGSISSSGTILWLVQCFLLVPSRNRVGENPGNAEFRKKFFRKDSAREVCRLASPSDRMEWPTSLNLLFTTTTPFPTNTAVSSFANGTK